MTKKSHVVKKETQLGMSLGKANDILRKSIMYNLVTQLDRHNCYHCKDGIILKDFSIEHIEPWLHTENPCDLFFNYKNIAYSHLKCNQKNKRKTFISNGNGREERNIQLGLNFGTANNQLRRQIIYQLLIELNKTQCVICHNEMTLENYSIEHVIPWLDSENPKELYFDLNNISFSHHACNVRAARKPHKIICPEGMGWCYICKYFKKIDEFPACKSYIKSKGCSKCESKDRSKYPRT